MNSRAELEAIISSAQRLLKQLEEAEGSTIALRPIFMSPLEYAKHCQHSEKTVRKWVRLGLPHKRRGKLILIKVAEADEWSEEGSTRRSAELDAHGAKR